MQQAQPIQAFLASRRARVQPESVGLPVAGRKRKVPGLRREEVASLAGVSADYYTRLERGGLTAASDGVIAAIGRALLLDEVETAHLFDLARAGRTRPAVRFSPALPITVARPVQALLDALVHVPAIVRNPILDVLAANEVARELYVDMVDGPVRPANLARFTFLDRRSREFWVDWEDIADDMVGHLYAAAGVDPHHEGLADLVADLGSGSSEFKRRWTRHDVCARARGSKRFRHGAVGLLELDYEVLQVVAEPRLSVITYAAEPGTSSHRALIQLADRARARTEGTGTWLAHGATATV